MEAWLTQRPHEEGRRLDASPAFQRSGGFPVKVGRWHGA
jgi:hypothetical protein